MTSESRDTPPERGAPDLILMALFQSRLRERSLHLGQVIQSQRRRLSAYAHDPQDDQDDSDAMHARLRIAEQSLAAVQEAEARLGLGRYGLCDNCQESIGWDELLQSPEQTTCKSCRQFGATKGSDLRN
jgi:RNA polymerase-binding transcription factor DksA